MNELNAEWVETQDTTGINYNLKFMLFSVIASVHLHRQNTAATSPNEIIRFTL